ncbi:lazarillo protein-like isoform X1 [Toxorhynchites rutilus septentrionalis]|uniref:lazarillo protein-like isoform X1 n=1 Tax=Toxorhynchites rutilus septentrionalis TaxID=329112 RepID=UPI0024796246|nr:lazarillo protein-like isoform X1 [Toxorhynchites rutilus septentrionalis]
MEAFSSVLIFCAFFISGLLSLDVTGPCRELPVVENFNLTQYMGSWYEIKRYENINQPNAECVTAQYTLNMTSSEVTVENTMKQLPNRNPLVARGRAITSPSANGRAMLNVRFDNTPPNIEDSDYWVLGTDYTNYALVWSCRGNNSHSVESAWVLSRTPVLDNMSHVYVNILIGTHLKPDSFRMTEQRNEYCNSAMTPTIKFLLTVLSLVLVSVSM